MHKNTTTQKKGNEKMKTQSRIFKMKSWIKELFENEFFFEDLIWFVVFAGAATVLLVKAF